MGISKHQQRLQKRVWKEWSVWPITNNESVYSIRLSGASGILYAWAYQRWHYCTKYSIFCSIMTTKYILSNRFIDRRQRTIFFCTRGLKSQMRQKRIKNNMGQIRQHLTLTSVINQVHVLFCLISHNIAPIYQTKPKTKVSDCWLFAMVWYGIY